MLGIVFGIILLIFMFVMLMALVHMKNNPYIKLATVDGDEDIKIADNYGATVSSHNSDQAEEAALEFLSQKEVGNIEIAALLGERIAEKLWLMAQDLIMKDDGEISAREVHQRILIMSYAANNFMADSAPIPLLAETAVSEFYNKAEDLSAVFYKHLSDMSAFSLYILNYRSNKPEEVGLIYAKLCDKEGNLQKIEEGNNVYNNFYNVCKGIYDNDISYK